MANVKTFLLSTEQRFEVEDCEKKELVLVVVQKREDTVDSLFN
jgi:hypothetical protein